MSAMAEYAMQIEEEGDLSDYECWYEHVGKKQEYEAEYNEYLDATANETGE